MGRRLAGVALLLTLGLFLVGGIALVRMDGAERAARPVRHGALLAKQGAGPTLLLTGEELAYLRAVWAASGELGSASGRVQALANALPHSGQLDGQWQREMEAALTDYRAAVGALRGIRAPKHLIATHVELLDAAGYYIGSVCLLDMTYRHIERVEEVKAEQHGMALDLLAAGNARFGQAMGELALP